MLTLNGPISDKPPIVAIDVALLLPEAINRKAREINKRYWLAHQEGFFFDETHYPHITLLQQFVDTKDMPRTIQSVEEALLGFQPLSLTVSRLAKISTTTHFMVEPNHDLQRLHEELSKALEPFDCENGDERAFYEDGEAPRPQDVQWVRNYRAKSSLKQFYPHITLGMGEVFDLEKPISFKTNRVILCHLGRFCTCRKIFKLWSLGVTSLNSTGS